VQYQLNVLHNTPAEVVNSLAYLVNQHPLRVSSIFLSPFDMGDFLVLVVALVAERISRDRRSWTNYLLLGGSIAALFASRVRADSLAALVVLGLAVLPSPPRPVTARIRLIAAIAIGAAIIIPSLGGTRFVGAQGGNASNQGHIREITNGIHAMVDHPLGLGIGVQPATANRFLLSGNQIGLYTTDNSITQVGDELGFQALLPWLGFLIAAGVALRRRARGHDPLVAGAGLALIGILIAGQYHHVFLTYPVPWTLWAAIGLALRDRSAEPRRTPRTRPHRTWAAPPTTIVGTPSRFVNR
jgi:hypothetical protein